jgi:hypothetical protein
VKTQLLPVSVTAHALESPFSAQAVPVPSSVPVQVAATAFVSVQPAGHVVD